MACDCASKLDALFGILHRRVERGLGDAKSQAGHEASRASEPFHCLFQPAADNAQEILFGDHDVIEVHLAHWPAFDAELLDIARLEAVFFAIHKKHGELIFTSTCYDRNEVCNRRVGGPHLLAANSEILAVSNRFGGDLANVGSYIRFADSRATNHFSAD